MLMVLIIIILSLNSFFLLPYIKKKNKLETLLLFLVINISQAFLAVLVMGILGILSKQSLILFHGFSFIIIIIHKVILFKNRITFKFLTSIIKINIKSLFIAIRKLSKKDMVKIALGLFIIALLYISFLNIILPIHDWDGFMYHMFIPATWIQQGSIHSFQAAPQLRLDKWVYFPSNIEMLSSWNLMLSGSDAAVEFTQFPIILAGILALIGLLRLFGVKNRYSVWILPAIISIPIFYCQLNSTYIDAVLSSLFFISAYLLIRGLLLKDKLILVTGIIASAILIGTKASGPLIFGGVVFLSIGTYIILTIKSIKNAPGVLRKAFLYSTIIILSSTTIGGYFFIRNFVEKGNPLYPYELKILNKTIFRGINVKEQTSSKKDFDKFKFLKSSYMDNYGKFSYNYYAHPYAGNGPLPLSVGLASFLFILILFLFTKKWRHLLLYLLMAITCFSITIIMPTLFPRFTIILTSFLIFSSVLALQHLAFGKFVLQIFFTGAIIYNLIISFPMNFHKKWYIKYALKSRNKLSASDSPYSGRQFKILDNLIKNQKAVIAYSGLLMPYPLFGRTLSRKVIYLKPSSFKTWKKNLQTQKVFCLVLGKPGFTYREFYWVYSNPSFFRRIISNRFLDVFILANKNNLIFYKKLLKGSRI